MDAFQEARAMLPSMPEEVFELWFDDRIRANGWPPVSRTWGGALREFSLPFWARLEWKLKTVTLSYEVLTAKAIHIIDGLIEANFYGASNCYSNYLDNSMQRIDRIGKFVKDRQSLPSLLIFVEIDGLLEIVDGSHRLAVFFEMKRKVASEAIIPSQVVAWVGHAHDV